MTRAFARYAKHLATLEAVMLLAFASPAFAADEFSFNYLEAGYSIDSTIQTFGQSFDSDDSYRIDGSYLFNRHVLAAAQYYSAGYDFEGNSDFGLYGYSLGVGYKGRITSKDTMPVEWFAVLSYEHLETHSQLHDVNYDKGRDGGGLKAGIRAAVTDRLELMVNGYLQSYGGDFLLRNGDLDGLSFELGGVLELRDNWSLTTSYRTGELDYLTLPNYPSKYKLELDRDEVFVGVRWSFE
jgi:Outer membrane protein beta-barrel domain